MKHIEPLPNFISTPNEIKLANKFREVFNCWPSSQQELEQFELNSGPGKNWVIKMLKDNRKIKENNLKRRNET